MTLVAFDPKKHEGVQMYEQQSSKVGDVIDISYAPVDVSFEQASKTPWYYMVQKPPILKVDK